MKKLIIILLVLFSFIVYAENNSSLDKRIEKNLSFLKNNPYYGKIYPYWQNVPKCICKIDNEQITSDYLLGWILKYNIRLETENKTTFDKTLKEALNKYIDFIFKYKAASKATGCSIDDKTTFNIILTHSEEKYNSWQDRPKDKNYLQWIESMGFDINIAIRQKAMNNIIEKWNNNLSTSLSKKISKQQVQNYYNKNKAKFKVEEQFELHQILIKPEKDNPAAWKKAEEKAIAILEKLKNGESFQELVSKHSAAKSKDFSGKVGHFIRGEMCYNNFEETCWKLAKTDLNKYEIVKTKQGYHIIKITSYTPEHYRLLSDVQKYIVNELVSEKKNNIVENAIKQEKEKTKVSISSQFIKLTEKPSIKSQ